MIQGRDERIGERGTVESAVSIADPLLSTSRQSVRPHRTWMSIYGKPNA